MWSLAVAWKRTRAGVLVDVVHPHPLLQRRLQGGGVGSGGQCPEVRECRGDAPVVGGCDGGEMDGEGVARFGVLDEERPGHRVQVRHLAHLRGQVRWAADEAAEAVLGVHLQDVAGADVGHRHPAAEGVGQLVAGGTVGDRFHAGHTRSTWRACGCAGARPDRAGRRPVR